MEPPEPDYYLDLGIPPSSSQSEIKKAYHRLAIIHHPDKKAPGEKVDAAEFRKIHTAYEFLSDASKRSWYDLRYMYVQRRWTQYHMWEQREEQRGAKQEESERRQAEAEKVRVEEEARRNRFQEEAEAEPRRARFQHEANFTSQPDASAVTPCVHPHIGKVWWKNGKADCTFCRADETFCYVCPVCDVAACPDCRTDLPC